MLSYREGEASNLLAGNLRAIVRGDTLPGGESAPCPFLKNLSTTWGKPVDNVALLSTGTGAWAGNRPGDVDTRVGACVTPQLKICTKVKVPYVRICPSIFCDLHHISKLFFRKTENTVFFPPYI